MTIHQKMYRVFKFLLFKKDWSHSRHYIILFILFNVIKQV